MWKMLVVGDCLDDCLGDFFSISHHEDRSGR